MSDRIIPYDNAADAMFKKLGECKIMALAASTNNHVTVRNVSVIFREQRIFFKTDINFPKTKQLLENPNVAVCVGGIQIEGLAINHGKVVDEPDRLFESLYQQYWDKSYNAYPHEETEILVEIKPVFAEIWDQDENDNGFQILIDFVDKEASVRYYDSV